MFRPLLTASISAVAITLSAPAAIAAAEPKAVASYKDWSVFVREADGDKICFAASEATGQIPEIGQSRRHLFPCGELEIRRRHQSAEPDDRLYAEPEARTDIAHRLRQMGNVCRRKTKPLLNQTKRGRPAGPRHAQGRRYARQRRLHQRHGDELHCAGFRTCAVRNRIFFRIPALERVRPSEMPPG